MPKTQPRAWQRMLSGRRLDLLDPTPVDIEIEDIAHGLAFVARWNGQTKGDYAYSVAEHSLLVTDIFARQNPKAPVKWQLAALLHDAPEYVIGDMISPVKAAVGPGYGALIKKADKVSAWLEAVQIAGFTRAEADKFFGKIDAQLAGSLSITLRPPVAVRDAFTNRFASLSEQL